MNCLAKVNIFGWPLLNGGVCPGKGLHLRQCPTRDITMCFQAQERCLHHIPVYTEDDFESYVITQRELEIGGWNAAIARLKSSTQSISES